MSGSASADLHEQIAQLTEERDYYKAELGLIRDTDLTNQIASRLGLTGKECEIVRALYAKPGSFLKKQALMEELYFDRADEPKTNVITVNVHRIRYKMGADAVETFYGRGYRLTPAGIELIKAAAGPTVH